MLGTMAGLWISIFLLFFCGAMFFGALLGSSDAPKVERGSILYFCLDGNVEERFEPGSFLEMIQSTESTAPTLDEMLTSLRAAANDDRISALYLDCRGSAMGMASRQELREAIEAFKEASGKPVFAYADSYGQGDYLLATTADSLYLNPMGAVDIHGVGGMTPFFKNTLDMLGIRMQILKVGTFKSAVEPFILDAMSEPARLQMQQYCDSLWNYAVASISASRPLPADSIRTLASQVLMARPASFFVESGIVDGLCYRREFDNMLAAFAGVDKAEDINMVTPAEYITATESINALMAGADRHIAVLYAVGDIVDSGDGGIVSEDMVPQIVELADDDNVCALVMRVNSGGGSAFASEQIWEALEYFKSKDKPFYVSMGDYAASGGYYISCGADRIFADETTITGSIGVFGMIPDFSGLITDKLGVTFSTVETNPNAVGITGMQAMTPEQAAAMQASVEDIYATFTGRVADGRHMEVDSVKAIAEGRVWTGGAALRLGLVDELGSLSEAIAAIASAADIDRSKVVAYPVVEEDMFLRMLRESGSFAELRRQAAASQISPETLEQIRFVEKLRNMNPMQARMETVIFR